MSMRVSTAPTDRRRAPPLYPDRFPYMLELPGDKAVRMVSAEYVHELWAQQASPGVHPLMPLVRAYLRQPCATCYRHASAPPTIDVATVHVDGEPMVTAGPEAMGAYRAIRRTDKQQNLFPLAGQARRETRSCTRCEHSPVTGARY